MTKQMEQDEAVEVDADGKSSDEEDFGDVDSGGTNSRGATSGGTASGGDSDASGEEQVEGASVEVDDSIDMSQVMRQVEAILMSIERPITPGKVAEAIGLDATGPVRKAMDQLNEAYTESGRSFTIEKVAGGYQILTLPEFREVVGALHRTRQDNKLSPAALEALAIIAYKQPVIRANIEAIRGVSSGEVLRSLMDKHLVKIVGRAEEIGRPMLYGTTKTFLQVFGLSSLKDLPKSEELIKP